MSNAKTSRCLALDKGYWEVPYSHISLKSFRNRLEIVTPTQFQPLLQIIHLILNTLVSTRKGKCYSQQKVPWEKTSWYIFYIHRYQSWINRVDLRGSTNHQHWFKFLCPLGNNKYQYTVSPGRFHIASLYVLYVGPCIWYIVLAGSSKRCLMGGEI